MKKQNRMRYYIIIAFIIFISIILFFFTSYENKKEVEYSTDFILTDVDGQSFKLSDFQGKVIILDFMATWCRPCRMEMHELIEVWQKYEGEIVIISIDVDPTESDEDIRNFYLDFNDATWIWAKNASDLVQFHQVSAIPTLVIIDQEGKITFKHTGLMSSSLLIEEIEKLINQV